MPEPAPAPIRGRWTIYQPYAMRPPTLGTNAVQIAGPPTPDPVEVVPVPDEAAIERGAKAHWAHQGEDWDDLPYEDRETLLCAFETGLRAALEPPGEGEESREPEPACETCHGEGRIDLNSEWRGPPGVERHHWVQCPDCDTPVRFWPGGGP